MNFNVTLSKDSLGRLFKKKKRLPLRCIGHPNRDWLILLGIFAIFIVGSFIYHLNIFFTVNTANQYPFSAGTQSTPINESELSAILSSIAAREAHFSELQETLPTTTDPSK